MAVCYWHSFVWSGSDVFGDGTLDRPWNAYGLDPLEAARHKMAAAFEFFAKLGTPVLLLPRPRHRTRGCDAGRDGGPPGRHGRGGGRAHGPHRGAPAVGDRQPLLAPALRRRGGHQPRSRGLRGGRRPGGPRPRGHPCPRRGQLRPVGRARGLRDAAQHRPGPRGGPTGPLPPPGGRAQAPDRVRGDDPDRAQAGRADQAPVRPRRGHRGRLPRATRPGRRGAAQPRGQPRHPGRPQLPPRGGDGGGRRALRLDRRQPGRPAERVGHRPVPELGRGVHPRPLRDPGRRRLHHRGINFDTKLRRQSVARDDLFHGHIGAMDTMARSLLAAASLLESGDLARFRRERYAGWERPPRRPDPGRLALPGRPPAAGSRRTASTRRPGRVARSCSSRSSTATSSGSDEPHPPSHSAFALAAGRVRAGSRPPRRGARPWSRP